MYKQLWEAEGLKRAQLGIAQKLLGVARRSIAMMLTITMFVAEHLKTKTQLLKEKVTIQYNTKSDLECNKKALFDVNFKIVTHSKSYRFYVCALYVGSDWYKD